MEQVIDSAEEWQASETRRLPLLNGSYQVVEGTRLLWHHYEDVLDHGAWSYRDLLNAVWTEQDVMGSDFSSAFHTIIAYRSEDVRLWRETLIEAHHDSLTSAGRQFRQAFAEAVSG